MAISTNGTVVARLAGGLYNTVLSNATYSEVASASLDISALANTLYSRDFANSTDLAVATTLLANLGLAGQAGLDVWVAAQLTAAGAANKGAKIVTLLNDFAGLASDVTWGTYATAWNTKVDAALAAAQTSGSLTGVFANAGAATAKAFDLTSSINTFVGTALNDTFTGVPTSLDNIDGGAGDDTLTFSSVDAIDTTGAVSATVTGIESATKLINANSQYIDLDWIDQFDHSQHWRSNHYYRCYNRHYRDSLYACRW